MALPCNWDLQTGKLMMEELEVWGWPVISCTSSPVLACRVTAHLIKQVLLTLPQLEGPLVPAYIEPFVPPYHGGVAGQKNDP